MKKLDIIVKKPEHEIKIPAKFDDLKKELFAISDKKHNGYLRVQISLPVRKRTTGEKSQNAHLNGHIRTIADALNRDTAQVKKYIKYRAIEIGYPQLLDENGFPVLDLWENYQGISESDSTVEECQLLIEMCHIFAAENGIELVES